MGWNPPLWAQYKALTAPLSVHELMASGRRASPKTSTCLRLSNKGLGSIISTSKKCCHVGVSGCARHTQCDDRDKCPDTYSSEHHSILPEEQARCFHYLNSARSSSRGWRASLAWSSKP